MGSGRAQKLTLAQPYLPKPPRSSSQKRTQSSRKGLDVESISDSNSRFGVRSLLRTQFHAFIYAIIHTVFSIYIRFRVFYHAVRDRIFAILYYHHRTPELIQKDVKSLKRLPQHLSVVLKLENGGRGGAGLEVLVDEVAEISAWCACVGISTLSVYEETGTEVLYQK